MEAIRWRAPGARRGTARHSNRDSNEEDMKRFVRAGGGGAPHGGAPHGGARRVRALYLDVLAALGVPHSAAPCRDHHPLHPDHCTATSSRPAGPRRYIAKCVTVSLFLSPLIFRNLSRWRGPEYIHISQRQASAFLNYPFAGAVWSRDAACCVTTRPSMVRCVYCENLENRVRCLSPSPQDRER